MIGIIILASAFFLGIYLTVRDAKNWDKLIKEAGKPKETEKTDRFIFVEEESQMKRCEYCGKEISEEEYERERYGYCDECSEDLATEEETEDLWGV